MARISRSADAFMAAYVILFLLIGPWLALSGPARRNVPQIVIGVFLAWRVTRGEQFGRIAWVLLIVYSIFGGFVAITGTSRSGGNLGTLGLLTGSVLQVALLVSAPVYERTHLEQPAPAPASAPGAAPVPAPPAAAPAPAPAPPAPPPPPAPASPWPAPRLRILLASVGAGLVITLIPVSGMKQLPDCPPAGHGPVPAPASCVARGVGYPGPYRFSGPVYAAGDLRPLSVAVRQHFSADALAVDWAEWSLATFALLYLVWLSARRDDPASDVRQPLAV